MAKPNNAIGFNVEIDVRPAAGGNGGVADVTERFNKVQDKLVRDPAFARDFKSAVKTSMEAVVAGDATLEWSTPIDADAFVSFDVGTATTLASTAPPTPAPQTTPSPTPQQIPLATTTAVSFKSGLAGIAKDDFLKQPIQNAYKETLASRMNAAADPSGVNQAAEATANDIKIGNVTEKAGNIIVFNIEVDVKAAAGVSGGDTDASRLAQEVTERVNKVQGKLVGDSGFATNFTSAVKTGMEAVVAGDATIELFLLCKA
eukprot:g322.t1